MWKTLRICAILSVATIMAAPQTRIPDETLRQRNRQFPFRLSAPMKNFGFDLFNQLSLGSRGNIVMSPFSLHTALAMLYFGSPRQSTTHRELSQVLFQSAPNPNTDESHLFNYWSILNRYKELIANRAIGFGNKLFLQRGFQPKKNFLETMATFFLSGAEEVDFRQRQRAANDVNQFVSRKTGGLIRDLIDPSAINSDTLMMLVNAIHFKANWKIQFHPSNTRTGVFSVDSQQRVTNQRMMKQSSHFRVANVRSLDARVLELPYEDPNFRMLIYLPNNVNGIADLGRRMAVNNFNTADIDKAVPTLVGVTLPKFKTGSKFDMIDPLMALGIREVFGSEADLSDITQGPLYVNQVIHQAEIEVNEEGTEAVAATAIGIGIRAQARELEFKVDRPFMFVIEDKERGMPLFVGRIIDPSGRRRLQRNDKRASEQDFGNASTVPQSSVSSDVPFPPPPPLSGALPPPPPFLSQPPPPVRNDQPPTTQNDQAPPPQGDAVTDLVDQIFGNPFTGTKDDVTDFEKEENEDYFNVQDDKVSGDQRPPPEVGERQGSVPQALQAAAPPPVGDDKPPCGPDGFHEVGDPAAVAFPCDGGDTNPVRNFNEEQRQFRNSRMANVDNQ